MKWRLVVCSLIIWYGFVAILCVLPNVSADYYDYYISKKTILSPKRKQKLLPLEGNSNYSVYAPYIVFFGWGCPQRGWRWNTRKRVTILFEIGDGALLSSFNAYMRIPRQRVLTWSVNGAQRVARVEKGDGWRTVPIRKEELISGINILECEISASEGIVGEKYRNSVAIQDIVLR